MRYVVARVMTNDGTESLVTFDHIGPHGEITPCAARGDNNIEALRRAELLEEDMNVFDKAQTRAAQEPCDCDAEVDEEHKANCCFWSKS
jgi:hypothetical protein